MLQNGAVVDDVTAKLSVRRLVQQVTLYWAVHRAHGLPLDQDTLCVCNDVFITVVCWIIIIIIIIIIVMVIVIELTLKVATFSSQSGSRL